MTLSSLLYVTSEWEYGLRHVFSEALNNLDKGGEARLTGMAPKKECHKKILDKAHDLLLTTHPESRISINKYTIVLK